MSSLGETYLLDEIDRLQKGYLKYFSVDEEDYKDWQQTLNKYDFLIVPEYRESFLSLFFKKEIGYRIYLDTKDNRKKVAQYKKDMSKRDKKNFLLGLAESFLTFLIICTVIYSYIYLFNLY